MAWKIDRDYLEETDSEYNRVGTTSLGPEMGDETFRFRLLDDDGEVYYGGVADRAAAENDEEVGGLYEALRWAMADAGAVNLEVHPADGIKYGLTSADYVERIAKLDPESNEGWVSIYG